MKSEQLSPHLWNSSRVFNTRRMDRVLSQGNNVVWDQVVSGHVGTAPSGAGRCAALTSLSLENVALLSYEDQLGRWCLLAGQIQSNPQKFINHNLTQWHWCHAFGGYITLFLLLLSILMKRPFFSFTLYLTIRKISELINTIRKWYKYLVKNDNEVAA